MPRDSPAALSIFVLACFAEHETNSIIPRDKPALILGTIAIHSCAVRLGVFVSNWLISTTDSAKSNLLLLKEMSL